MISIKKFKYMNFMPLETIYNTGLDFYATSVY